MVSDSPRGHHLNVSTDVQARGHGHARTSRNPIPTSYWGAAAVAGGMFWFSRLTEHAGYAGQLLGPQLVTSFGLGLVFVPLSLVSLHNVAEQDSGVARNCPVPCRRHKSPAPQPAASQPGTVQRHEDRAALAAATRPCRFC